MPIDKDERHDDWLLRGADEWFGDEPSQQEINESAEGAREDEREEI